MKKICLFLLIICNVLIALPQTKNVYVKKSIITPVIDGVVDAIWSSADHNNISLPFKSETPSLGLPGETTWQGLWTDDGIYILLNVTDDVFFPSYAVTPQGNNWEYDKPELYFDVNQVLKDGLGVNSEQGHYEIAPGFTEGKTDGTLFTDPSGFKYAFKVNTGGYVAEYFVPFSLLKDKTGAVLNKAGDIGFDVTIIDRDTKDIQRNRAVWANVGAISESYIIMDDCGVINLIDGPDIDFQRYNLLKDGTFPQEGALIGPWKSWSGFMGTAEVKNGVCKMNPVAVGDIYMMQVFQQWQAKNDTSYYLIFTVWGDVNRTFNIHFEDDPAHNYNFFGTSTDKESVGGRCNWDIPVTTSPVTWILSGKADCLDNTSDPRLMIMTGDQLGIVYIDNIAIVREKDINFSNQFLVDLTPEISLTCGESLQLNPYIIYENPAELTCSWIPSGGLSDPGIKNPVASPVSNTTYTLTTKAPGFDPIVKKISINMTPATSNPEICIVNVDENDRNVVVIRKTASTSIQSYFVYRESSLQTNQYDLVGEVPFADDPVFVDVHSNAKVQSNKYKIAVNDICGFVSGKSPEHKTMHLTINQGVGNNWNLIWEQYAGVPVSSYSIFRGTSKTDLTEIGNTSGSNTSFTDITAPSGDLYYQVRGILTDPCTSLKSSEYSTVRSNIIANFDDLVEKIGMPVEQHFFYPNPATSTLNIKPGYTAGAIIEVYNPGGVKVLTGKITDVIDISSLPKGLFIVKLIEPGEIHIDKLVKE